MAKQEFANKGVAFYECEYGLMKINYENDKVIALDIISKGKRTKGSNNIYKLILDYKAIKTSLTELVYKEFLEYFMGQRKYFDFPFELRGTDFQKRVWQELLKIPYGEIRSYKDIAIGIGNPKACRAVGGANNKNPILLLIPCHRVIGSNGSLTGYAAGLGLKSELLRLEKKNNTRQFT